MFLIEKSGEYWGRLIQCGHSFRDERLDCIERRETPVQLPDKPKAAIHIIPSQAPEPEASLDLVRARDESSRIALSLPESPVFGSDDDGVYHHVRLLGAEQSIYYRKIYQKGMVESVTASIGFESDKKGYIFEVCRLNSWVLDYSYSLIDMLKSIGQPFPVLVMFSFLGFSEYTIPNDHDRIARDPDPIGTNLLCLPDIRLENYIARLKWHEKVRPILDQLWMRSGHPNWPGQRPYPTWKP